MRKGDLLNNDTIRSWYPTPLWKNYMLDVTAENNPGANQLNGATNGSNGNMYLYRVAEAYLIRAEAKYYQGKNADVDVNIIRRRANAKKMLTNMTIGDIVDERARELTRSQRSTPGDHEGRSIKAGTQDKVMPD